MSITLTADIGFADGVLPVTADPPSDRVQIDAEQIDIRNHGTTSLLVTRGVNGTQPTSHASSAVVTPLYEVAQTQTPPATPLPSPASQTSDFLASETITSATPATERLIRSELTLTPATTLAVASSGSLAALRGLLTLTTGKSVTAGYLYGTQGKIVADGGTINVGSGYVTGVLGQLSLTGTTLTSGHIAPLIANVGPSAPASANVDLIYAEVEQGPINSVLKAYANTNYIFDLTAETNAGSYSTTGSAGTTTAKGWLKVKVGGADRFIPLSDSGS